MSEEKFPADKYTPEQFCVRNRDRVYHMQMGQTTAVFHTPEEVFASARMSFRNDDAIQTVHLPEGMTELPDSYFYGCTALTHVYLPSTLRVIGRFAFYGCKALKEIDLPESLQRIEEYAFAGCASLLCVALPQRVESVGTAAFRGCSALSRLRFADNPRLTEMGSHCLQFCAALEDFSLPPGIKVLNTSTFCGCSGVRRIDIPATVSLVQKNAFYRSNLSEICFLSGETMLEPHGLDGLENTSCVLRMGDICLPIGQRDFEDPVKVSSLTEEVALSV